MTGPAPRRRTGVVAVLAAAALLAAGCTAQARKEQAALAVRSARATVRLGRATARLESSVRVHERNGLVEKDSRWVRLPDATLQLDLAHQRSVLTPSVDSPRLPEAVAFSAWDIFVKPRAVAGEDGSVQQQAWLWLDGGALDPDRRTRLSAPTPLLLLPPHLLLRLPAGALTGSVRRLGTETIGDVQTTHLRFNIDRDKAARGLSDRDKQRLKLLFLADDIDGTFFHGAEAWIDGHDVLRRLVVHLVQVIDDANSFELTYQLDLAPAGPDAAPLPLPNPDDLAEVPTLPELLPGASA